MILRYFETHILATYGANIDIDINASTQANSKTNADTVQQDAGAIANTDANTH